MARPRRVEFDGPLYHVFSRGNARENIFDEGGDRKTVFEVLRKVVNRLARYATPTRQRKVADFLDLHYVTVS